MNIVTLYTQCYKLGYEFLLMILIVELLPFTYTCCCFAIQQDFQSLDVGVVNFILSEKTKLNILQVPNVVSFPFL